MDNQFITYEEFKNDFLNRLNEEAYKYGAELEPQVLSKVNTAGRDALIVHYKGSQMAPVIYMDEQYELMKSGYDMDAVVSQTMAMADQAYINSPALVNIDAEYIKENAYCTVIGKCENTELLATVPYEIIAEDIAVIPRCRIGESGSFIINRSVASSFHFTDEEVMQYAHIGMQKETYTCRNLEDVLNEMIGADVDAESIIEDKPQIYLLTNATGIEGAAGIASEEVMKKARQKIGENFYILPSSRHEVLLVPESTAQSRAYLAEMVQNVNATSVAERDILTNSIYCSNGKSIAKIKEDILTTGADIEDILTTSKKMVVSQKKRLMP